MTNILVAYDGFEVVNILGDGWDVANWFFGARRLLNAVATLAVIRTEGNEDLDKVLTETAHEIIGRRVDEECEDSPPPDITDDEREQIVHYLKESYKACQPYLPSSGSLQLHSYVRSEDGTKLYLVLKHFGKDEYPGKVVPGDTVRDKTPSS